MILELCCYQYKQISTMKNEVLRIVLLPIQADKYNEALLDLWRLNSHTFMSLSNKPP